jgi:hypothetical protein
MDEGDARLTSENNQQENFGSACQINDHKLAVASQLVGVAHHHQRVEGHS